MRLWTLHPRHLDARGLVALWRETLLAQAVLLNKTKGYKHHPQLQRFRAHPRPAAALATYLTIICDEADVRGYTFNRAKIAKPRTRTPIPATRAQLLYEWQHLKRKLKSRDPARHRLTRNIPTPDHHPLFTIISGGIAPWEKTEN